MDFYSMINRMPRMIVVAIVHSDRMHELSTASSGGSSRFPSFLREELIPFIDGQFRTEPFRILVGHSLGGLFAAHLLFEAPGLFQAHIAASPARYWNGGSGLARAREVLSSAPSLRNFLYLTYSGGDGEDIRTSAGQLIDGDFQVLTHKFENGFAPVQQLAIPRGMNLTVSSDEAVSCGLHPLARNAGWWVG